MSELVPEGWTVEKLGDLLVGIGDGGTPSTNNDSYFGGGIPWVVITDIERQIESTKTTLSKLGLKKSSAKLWDEETVILSTGATIGKIGIAKVPLTTKQGITGLQCGEKLHPYYLMYLLIHRKPELLSLAQGSTIKEVRPPTLVKTDIQLPSFPEQQKIASILTSVDEVIEKTQAQINKLQDLKKGTMNELLTRGIGHSEFKESPVGRIPKGWEVKRLGELSEVKRGASPRPIKDPKWWGGSIGWTRISDVTSSAKYLNKTKDYLSDEGVQNSVRIQKGEVILSICATIGRPIIVNTDVCIHDGFVWFNDLSSNIDTEYFYYFLSSKEEELSSSRQTGTQGNLNTGIVSRLEVRLPDFPEQQKIASILTSIDTHIEDKQRKLQQIQSLKKSLMQDLLTGKVRVTVN